MNLLISWHVRTKENIARVRRDETAAQENERERQNKLELAESEARINFLRLRRQTGVAEGVTTVAVGPATTNGATGSSGEENSELQTTPSSAFDLFANYKTHIKKTNKDLEKEKKEEQETYEKQIGYLTYLGQDTNEALKVLSWYQVAPKRTSKNVDNEETYSKQKLSQDPLTLINSMISTRKKTVTSEIERSGNTSCPESTSKSKDTKKQKKKRMKHKKHNQKSHKSEQISKEFVSNAKRDKLNRLRKERLLREASEQRRQEQLFAQKDPGIPANPASMTPAATPRIVQKYNSQFNPEFAKQNKP
ncbi:hypothetical protein KR044_003001 [Drosophila immigrans]|nr:hypothetical protein KR044_003001 [Drosophila immigrans]